MSNQRISVTHGDTTYEATIEWQGTHSKATHLDPEEWPTPSIDECWRTVGNGIEVKIRPDFIPEDIHEEILKRADDPNYYGPGDEPTSACDAGSCGHERC